MISNRIDHWHRMGRRRGNSKHIARVILIVIACALQPTGAWAQNYTGAVTGPVTGNGGAITITNTGSITNAGNSVAVQGLSGSQSITILTNDGTLSAGTNTVKTNSGGTAGSITTLQNDSTIIATSASGIGVSVLGTIDTLNNATGASITGGTSAGSGSGILVSGNTGILGALNNAGTISGSTGISANGILTAVDNQSGGLISGTNGYGVLGGNYIGSFINEAGASVSGSLNSFKLNASNAGPRPGTPVAKRRAGDARIRQPSVEPRALVGDDALGSHDAAARCLPPGPMFTSWPGVCQLAERLPSG